MSNIQHLSRRRSNKNSLKSTIVTLGRISVNNSVSSLFEMSQKDTFYEYTGFEGDVSGLETETGPGFCF